MRPSLSRLIPAFALLAGLLGPALAAEPRYLVEAELWIDGVQRGTPSMQIKAYTEASLETGNDDEGWRLEVEVEPVDDVYAPANTLWVHVAVYQRMGDDWDHLADSILGVPKGEFATLTVVDGDAPATPETAHVYLRIRTSRAPDSEPELAAPDP